VAAFRIGGAIMSDDLDYFSDIVARISSAYNDTHVLVQFDGYDGLKTAIVQRHRIKNSDNVQTDHIARAAFINAPKYPDPVCRIIKSLIDVKPVVFEYNDTLAAWDYVKASPQPFSSVSA